MKYSQKQLDTFFSFKHAGTLKAADISAKVVSKECGDVFKIFANVEDGKISEAKFQAFGSVTIFNVMTYVVDLILGKKIEELAKITRQNLLACFDEFSKGKYAILDNAIILIKKVYTKGLVVASKPKNITSETKDTKEIIHKEQTRSITSQPKPDTSLSESQFIVNSDSNKLINEENIDLKQKPVSGMLVEQCINLLLNDNEQQSTQAQTKPKEQKTRVTSYEKPKSTKNKDSANKITTKTLSPQTNKPVTKKTTKQISDTTTEISFEDAIKIINKKRNSKKTPIKKNSLLDDDNFDMVDEIDTITARLSEAVSKLKNKKTD